MVTASLSRSLGVLLSFVFFSCSLSFSSPLSYGDIPLSFEPNRGQAGKDVQFLAHGKGYGFYLGNNEAMLMVGNRGDARAIRIRAEHSAPVVPAGEDLLPGVANYFRGDDPAKWVRRVPTFARVRLAAVYPGIDLVYYGTNRQLEYDFIVQPYADPAQIALVIAGTSGMELTPEGDLLLAAGPVELRWHAPIAYQLVNGARVPVTAQYEVKGTRVGFKIFQYDPSHELVIDPVLVYSSYLGGDGGSYGDVGNAIAVDGDGNAYVAGFAASANFHVTDDPAQSYNAGGGDVFVSKLNPRGTELVYSTYLGGGGDDTALGIAVNSEGEAYVTGHSGSGLNGTTPFPTTPAAYRRMPNPQSLNNSVFVSKLSADGSQLLYSTYITGTNDSSATGIAVDGAGSAYVVVNTAPGYPTTAGAYQRTPGSDECPYSVFADGAAQAVSKLSADGSRLVYSTYLGHGCDYGSGIAVNGAGEAYVTGHTQSRRFPVTPGVRQGTFGGVADAFVTRLNAAGNGLVYSTFLGGQLADFSNSIAVDRGGYAYIAGGTDGFFPVTGGAYKTGFANDGMRKGFVSKLSPMGKVLNFSTYISGTQDVSFNGVAVDTASRVYVTGYTTAANYPVTAGAVQNTCFKSGGDCMTAAVVTQLNSAGSAILYSSYFGASDGNNQYFPGNMGQAIAVDPSSNFYITGRTSDGLRTTTGSVQRAYPATSTSTSAFAAKFSAREAAQVVIRSPKNGSTPLSPVLVSAEARDSRPVRVLQVYVDGEKCHEVPANRVEVQLPMAAGAHRISVQAMDNTGATYRNTVNIQTSD